MNMIDEFRGHLEGASIEAKVTALILCNMQRDLLCRVLLRQIESQYEEDVREAMESGQIPDDLIPLVTCAITACDWRRANHRSLWRRLVDWLI